MNKTIKIEDEILTLLNSMSKEDIVFGISLAKEYRISSKIKKILKKSALKHDEWSDDKSHPKREERWCISASGNGRIYRCLKFDYDEVIYL